MLDRSSSSPRIGFVILVALLATLAGAKAILFDTLDPDCFWHLKVAEALQEQGIGPIVDDLSFASDKTPWTPYSWLAELMMKAIWDVGGFRLAILVQAMMQAAFVVGIAMASVEMCRQVSDASRRWPIVIGCILAGYWSLPFLSFRPVTMVLVILAFSAWLLLRDRRMHETSPAVWWLVPLTVLATNMHLFAFFVPMWIGCLLAGSVIERFRAHDAAMASTTRSVRRYAILLAATSCAFLCTPMLRGMLDTILFYSTTDAMVASPIIAEMHSILRGSYLNAALLLVLLVCVYRARRQLCAGEILWLICSVALLFKLGRFAPIFAIIASPFLAATLPNISDRALGKPAAQIALAIILVLCLGRITLDFPRSDQSLSAWLNRHGPEAPGYPTAAADFVQHGISPVTGRIINEFTWGGYLEWRLHARFRTLLDGRTQVFPQTLWQSTYLGDEDDRRQLIHSTHADAAIIPTGRSLFRDALQSAGWQSVHKDERAEVMIPPPTHARTE